MRNFSDRFVIFSIGIELIIMPISADKDISSNTNLNKFRTELDDDLCEYIGKVKNALNEWVNMYDEIIYMLTDKINEVRVSINNYDTLSKDNTLDNALKVSESVVIRFNNLMEELKKEIELLPKTMMERAVINLKDRFLEINLMIKKLKEYGDIASAIKMQQILNTFNNNLITLAGEELKCVLLEFSEKINFFNNYFNESYKFFKELKDTHATNLDINTSKSIKTNFLRKYKDLEKYLMMEGFTIDRCNGSHQVFKNESGEVRVLPKRSGNHILAAKTAKNVIFGINN